MSPLKKWKLTSGALALTTLLSLGAAYRRPDSDGPLPQRRAEKAAEARFQSLQRLRIPASMAGVDEDALLQDLESATTTVRLRLICEKLAIFGTDRAVEPLTRLVRRRRDVASEAIAALGGIGTDKAIDELLKLAEHSNLRYLAIYSLARSGHSLARQKVMEWAQSKGSSKQTYSIGSLGYLGSDDDVMALLRDIADHGSHDHRMEAARSLSVIATEAAVGIMQDLASTGNAVLKRQVLQLLPGSLNSEQQEWVIDMLATGDAATASAAADALGRSKASDALPLLVDAAKTGNYSVQSAAARALMAIGSKEAIAATREIFKSAQRYAAYDIASALLDDGGEENRALVMEALQTPSPARTQLLSLLQHFEGEEAIAIQREILREGTMQEKSTILRQLSDTDDVELAAAIVELARTGPQQVRYAAVESLARTGTNEAKEALLDLAGSSRGVASADALRVIGQYMPSDEGTVRVLTEALNSGHPDRQRAAITGLAASELPEAKSALIAAMRSEDTTLVNAVFQSIGYQRTPDLTDVIVEIARDDSRPNVRAEAMNQLITAGDPVGLELLESALRDGDEQAARYLYSAVSMSTGDSSLINAATESTSAAIRGSAADALASVGDSAAVSKLEKLIDDEDPQVRGRAIYALARSGGPGSLDRIANLASSDESYVRSAALSALIENGHERATQLVQAELRSDDSTRVQSAMNLTYRMGKEINGELERIANDDSFDQYMRQNAASMLKARGVKLSAEAEKLIADRPSYYGY